MAMTREDAKNTIYQLINSGILDSELEERLTKIANHICEDNFEDCIGTEYCKAEACPFQKK